MADIFFSARNTFGSSSRLNQIVNVAKRNPELIQLLEMHNQFKTISQYGGDVRVSSACMAG